MCSHIREAHAPSRENERRTRSTASRCVISRYARCDRVALSDSDHHGLPPLGCIRLARDSRTHERTETRMGDKDRGDIASVTPATPEDAAKAELYKEEANEYFKST